MSALYKSLESNVVYVEMGTESPSQFVHLEGCAMYAYDSNGVFNQDRSFGFLQDGCLCDRSSDILCKNGNAHSFVSRHFGNYAFTSTERKFFSYIF